MKILAPAKINLFLEVLGRDENGYHRIKTVFQTVGLYDEVILKEKNSGIEVICRSGEREVSGQLSGKANIAYKAAELLLARAGINRGIEITINKNIPVAAGLAGGSTDAAAVLKGLNELWGLKLSREALSGIARRLGADVAYFLHGGTALGEGYGDIITPLPAIKERLVLLVRPGILVSSGWAYGRLNEKIRLTEVEKVTNIDKQLMGDIGSLLFNRLEEAVIPEYTVIRELKEFLVDSGADCSLMSGSGPVVFAFVRDKETGNRIKNEVTGAFGCAAWLISTC